MATDEDVYVLAQSDARIDKERGMRRKRLRRFVDRLQALKGQALTRDQLLMKLGAAKHEAGRAANLVQLTIPKASAKWPSSRTACRNRMYQYVYQPGLGIQESTIHAPCSWHSLSRCRTGARRARVAAND